MYHAFQLKIKIKTDAALNNITVKKSLYCRFAVLLELLINFIWLNDDFLQLDTALQHTKDVSMQFLISY